MIDCNMCKNATILWLSTDNPRIHDASGYVLCRLRHPKRGLKVLSANKYSCNNYVQRENEEAKTITETSEQRQERLKCNLGRGINNWRCEVDCAFWNGERCTREDDEGGDGE